MRQLSIGVTLGLGALVLAACDTTAFVSPKIRNLSEIRSPGAVGTVCNFGSAEARYDLRFVATDTDQSPIEPGDRLVGYTVTLNETFGVANLSIANNQGRIFPAPDIACQTDADCTASGFAGFTCADLGTATSAGDAVPRVCGRDTAVNLVASELLEYVGGSTGESDDRRRSIMMLFHDGSTVIGRQRTGTGVIDQAFRTDPRNQRSTGLLQGLGGFLRSTSPFAGSAELCFATYRASEGSVRYLLSNTSDPGSCFRRFPRLVSDDRGEREQAESQYRSYQNELLLQANRGEVGENNFWAAALSGIRQLEQNARNNSERHLVLFTDQDLVDPTIRAEAEALQLNFQTTLAAATAAGVIVHVVQLDNPTPEMRKRGPIVDLANLACQSGGSYFYAERPESLVETFTNLTAALGAHYQTKFELSGVVGSVPPGNYRLQTALLATMRDTTRTFDFGGYVGTGSGRVDRRMNVFLHGCSATSTCRTGEVCDAGTCVPETIDLIGAGPPPDPGPTPDPDPDPTPDPDGSGDAT